MGKLFKKITTFQIALILFIFLNIQISKNVQAETEKIAYLTFDDGPSRNTQKIVDILDQYNAKGTFFVIGEKLKKNNVSIITKLIDNDHYIGLHTMSHNQRTLYNGFDSPKIFVKEIIEEQTLLFSITGTYVYIVRPPYSDGVKLTNEHIDELVKYNFRVWDWHVDTRDWAAKSVYQVLRNTKKELVLAKYPDKIVVLMHERDITVLALPSVIELLKQKGYNKFYAYDPNNHFPINFKQDPNL